MSCSRAQTTQKHHIANLTAKKLLVQLFGFGLTHAPEKPQEVDRRHTVVGQVRGRGKHCLQRAVWQDSGINTLKMNRVIESYCPAASASLPLPRQAAGRWLQGGTVR